MKKAKIMLTAIAIFGLVGGAMALKARSTFFMYKRVNNVCPLIQPQKYELGGNVPYQSIFTTFQTTTTQVPTSLCTLTTSLVIE